VLNKSEFKAAFAHSLGCDSDDDLEAAERDALRYTGRVQAARLLEQKISQVIAKLKRDMDDDVPPPFPDREGLKQAVHYLGMCLAQASTLARQSDNLRLQMEGKAMAFTHTIKRLAKLKDDAEHKGAAVAAAAHSVAQDGRPPVRVVGVHPGPSLKQQRLAEMTGNGNGANGTAKKKAKKAKKKATKKATKKKR
jgi:hypothetical protein